MNCTTPVEEETTSADEESEVIVVALAIPVGISLLVYAGFAARAYRTWQQLAPAASQGVSQNDFERLAQRDRADTERKVTQLTSAANSFKTQATRAAGSNSENRERQSWSCLVSQQNRADRTAMGSAWEEADAMQEGSRDLSDRNYTTPHVAQICCHSVTNVTTLIDDVLTSLRDSNRQGNCNVYIPYAAVP